MRYYRKKKFIKPVLILLILIYIIDYFGILKHYFELDYYKKFEYPLEGDILKFAHQFQFNKYSEVNPINFYDYEFIKTAKEKCNPKQEGRSIPKIVVIVKSAMKNFERRNIIRQTWGNESRLVDSAIRVLFSLGISVKSPKTQDFIDAESDRYKDIFQANFEDSYFNNTIKTMMGFKWATNFCPISEYYFFVDDDYYVSMKNLIKFTEFPKKYPNANEDPLPVYDFSSEDDRLFAGFVFNSAPHRHKFSKWYVPLSEYPYHMWPPYVTSGAFVLSRDALLDMYFTSMFTKHFRFDDIFLGIVAQKARIAPFHSEEFYFYKARYYGPKSYKNVIALHGYEDMNKMKNIWKECDAFGFV